MAWAFFGCTRRCTSSAAKAHRASCSPAFLFNIDLDWLWKLWPLALVAIGLAMIFDKRES